jgi:hypothetical protein
VRSWLSREFLISDPATPSTAQSKTAATINPAPAVGASAAQTPTVTTIPAPRASCGGRPLPAMKTTALAGSSDTPCGCAAAKVMLEAVRTAISMSRDTSFGVRRQSMGHSSVPTLKTTREITMANPLPAIDTEGDDVSVTITTVTTTMNRNGANSRCCRLWRRRASAFAATRRSLIPRRLLPTSASSRFAMADLRVERLC